MPSEMLEGLLVVCDCAIMSLKAGLSLGLFTLAQGVLVGVKAVVVRTFLRSVRTRSAGLSAASVIERLGALARSARLAAGLNQDCAVEEVESEGMSAISSFLEARTDGDAGSLPSPGLPKSLV